MNNQNGLSIDYKLIAAMCMTLSLSACATVTKGKNFEVQVTSTPSDANVKFSTLGISYQAPTCVTPCSIQLKRSVSYKTTVSKDGYDTYTVMLSPKITGGGVVAGAGNIIAGGLVGLYVDAEHGANKDLFPNPINVTLEPIATGAKSYRTDADGNKVNENG